MAYHVMLDKFEGPLDLLLYLVSRAQVDIRDIFVSKITEQYLGFVAQLKGEDLEKASEFIEMAARLIEIKSRKLLPRPRVEDENEEDPEAALIRQLEEYKLFKLACEELKQNEQEASLRYYRMPEEIVEKTELDLNNVTVQNLMEAFQDLMTRFEEEDEEDEPLQEIQRETFTVQEKIFYIRRRLLSEKKVIFQQLFDQDTSRQEVVVTFIAMLELIKLNRLTIKQDENDGTIHMELIQREG